LSEKRGGDAKRRRLGEGGSGRAQNTQLRWMPLENESEKDQQWWGGNYLPYQKKGKTGPRKPGRAYMLPGAGRGRATYTTTNGEKKSYLGVRPRVDESIGITMLQRGRLLEEATMTRKEDSTRVELRGLRESFKKWKGRGAGCG